LCGSSGCCASGQSGRRPLGVWGFALAVVQVLAVMGSWLSPWLLKGLQEA
jgi:hypothetical protein